MSEPTSTADVPIAPEPAPLSRLRGAAVLAALLMGILLGALDSFIVATVLPRIALDLHDLSGQVFVVTGYLIAQTVAIPIFGKLSDRFGRRSFYLLGLVIFLIGSVLSAFSQNINQLVLFRAVQGLGSGAFFTVVFSIVADLFPPKAAARLAGVLSGVFGIAIVFGPLLGSVIVDYTTWRWIFFVNVPVGAAAIALVLTSLDPLLPKSQPKAAFDAAGAALLATWVGTLIFALFEVSQPGGWAWTDPRTLSLLAVALGLLPVFLWQESRAGDPLVPLQFFRKRLIAAASGINFLRGAILTIVVALVPILVVQGLHGSTDDGRNILYAFMVPMVVGAALGGVLVGRVGYRPPVALGLSLAVVGCWLLTTVPTVPPVFRVVPLFPAGLIEALIPLGFGVGLTFAPTQLAIQYSVPRDQIGTGNSLVWFIGNLGGSIVLSVLVTFQLASFDTHLQANLATAVTAQQLSNAVPSAMAVSLQVVWWGLVPLAVVGTLLALFLAGRLPENAEGPEAPGPG